MSRRTPAPVTAAGIRRAPPSQALLVASCLIALAASPATGAKAAAPPGPSPGAETTAVANGQLPAGRPLSVEDVIAAVGRVEPAEVEAALLARGGRFALDGATLLRLAEAKVPAGIIDLMVALSYPRHFIVESDGYPLRRPRAEELGGYGPLYPYPYAWLPFYDFGYYDYGHGACCPHPSPLPPIAPPAEVVHGRVVEGQGYTRIRRRGGPGETGDGASSPSGSSGSSDGWTGGGPSGDSGSVSSAGYSGGGASSSDRTARPRND